MFKLELRYHFSLSVSAQNACWCEDQTQEGEEKEGKI